MLRGARWLVDAKLWLAILIFTSGMSAFIFEKCLGYLAPTGMETLIGGI